MIKFYMMVDFVVKTSLRLEASMMRSQRTAAIAVRCLSPSMVALMHKTVSRTRRREGDAFMARADLAAPVVEAQSVDPESCPHTEVESYGNPSGKFRSCKLCRRRWKAVPTSTTGADVWVEHGFKPVTEPAQLVW